MALYNARQTFDRFAARQNQTIADLHGMVTGVAETAEGDALQLTECVSTKSGSKQIDLPTPAPVPPQAYLVWVPNRQPIAPQSTGSSEKTPGGEPRGNPRR
jgi:hypothetical protein